MCYTNILNIKLHILTTNNQIAPQFCHSTFELPAEHFLELSEATEIT